VDSVEKPGQNRGRVVSSLPISLAHIMNKMSWCTKFNCKYEQEPGSIILKAGSSNPALQAHRKNHYTIKY